MCTEKLGNMMAVLSLISQITEKVGEAGRCVVKWPVLKDLLTRATPDSKVCKSQSKELESVSSCPRKRSPSLRQPR